MSLTPARLNVLHAIADLTRLHGRPPTMRVLAARLGIKAPTACGHIARLFDDGYLDGAGRIKRPVVWEIDESQAVKTAGTLGARGVQIGALV